VNGIGQHHRQRYRGWQEAVTRRLLGGILLIGVTVQRGVQRFGAKQIITGVLCGLFVVFSLRGRCGAVVDGDDEAATD
jgi:hypothetical protein